MQINNKKLVITLIVFVVLTLGMGFYILYDKGFLVLDYVRNIQKESKIIITNNSVDHEALNYVLDIIGIPYYNNVSNACLTDELSNNQYSKNAKEIISLYIDSHDNVSLKKPPDEIYNSLECNMESVDCYTITKDKADTLFKMYNFEGKLTDYFQVSSKLENEYIFWYAHTLGICDTKINHNLKAEYTSEASFNKNQVKVEPDIRIIDKQTVSKFNANNEQSRETNISRTIIYDFKYSGDDIYYYLDNVTVK